MYVIKQASILMNTVKHCTSTHQMETSSTNARILIIPVRQLRKFKICQKFELRFVVRISPVTFTFTKEIWKTRQNRPIEDTPERSEWEVVPAASVLCFPVVLFSIMSLLLFTFRLLVYSMCQSNSELYAICYEFLDYHAFLSEFSSLWIIFLFQCAWMCYFQACLFIAWEYEWLTTTVGLRPQNNWFWLRCRIL